MDPMRTVLIGAGGTGSILARPLWHYMLATTNANCELVIVDGDEVEPKNLARQMFHPEENGFSKAQKLGESLRTPGSSAVRIIKQYLDTGMAESLFYENDRVILAVDNFPVRAMVDRHAAGMHNVTIINPGNEDWTATCQVHIRREGINITPRITYMHDEITSPPVEVNEPAHDCAVRAVTGEEQTIAANMLAASMALNAMVAVTHYDAYNEPIGFHETYYDLKKNIAGGPDYRKYGDEWA